MVMEPRRARCHAARGDAGRGARRRAVYARHGIRAVSAGGPANGAHKMELAGTEGLVERVMQEWREEEVERID